MLGEKADGRARRGVDGVLGQPLHCYNDGLYILARSHKRVHDPSLGLLFKSLEGHRAFVLLGDHMEVGTAE